MDTKTAAPAVCCDEVCAPGTTPPEGWLVVDVRTPGEFGEAHIAGAINAPLPDLDQLRPELEKAAAGKRVLLVCRTGGRARAAAEKLAGMGDCQVLEGGLAAWMAAGRPVQRGRKAISLERQVRIVAGSLVALGTGLGAFVSPWFLVLPAFVGLGLVFAGVTDTCGMALLLARLPFNRAGKPACCATASGKER